jgi:fumarate reductase flavoprotein subunit
VAAQVRDEQRRLEQDFLDRTGGGERMSAIRSQMQETMEDATGIYRDGDTLAKATDRLRELRERAASATIDDASRTFNTELTAALELDGMVDLAEAIVHSALHRQESRGAHQRTDFPARDDRHFLAHSVVSRDGDGPPRVEQLPVTITRWPPGERVYGR